MPINTTQPVIPHTLTTGGTPVFQMPPEDKTGFFQLKVFSAGAGENAAIVIMPSVPGETTISASGNAGTVIVEGTIDPDAAIMADKADYDEILADDSTPSALDTESNYSAYLLTFTGANSTASIRYRMRR